MVPVVAELTARRIPSLCKKTSVGCAGKQQRGSLMILAGTTALEENDSSPRARSVRHAALLRTATTRGSIIVTGNRRARVANGHLSRLGRALSRAAAYEKAPRRNN